MLNTIFKDHPLISLNIQYKGQEIGDIKEYHDIDRESVDSEEGFLIFTREGEKHLIRMTDINNGCFYESPDKKHYLWFKPDKNIAVEYFPDQKEKTYSL